MGKILVKLRRFLNQPATWKLKVVDCSGLDLSLFYGSLGNFFEEVFFNAEKYPQYVLPREGVVYIGADDGKMASGDLSCTCLNVSFEEKEISLNEIRNALDKLGIKTVVV